MSFFLRLNINKIFILIFCFFINNNLHSQSLDIVKDKITASVQTLHRQKIFVHTDKTEYYGGDTIRIKAYILNNENKADTFSTNLYIDLLYPSGYKKINALLLINKGIATGQFILPDTISKGIYILRAYTQFMRNFDKSYFFYKPVNINSENYFFYEKELYSKTKKFVKQKDKIQISIYPENGKLASEVENKVFFAAQNGYKESVFVTGSLIDGKKNLILKFDSKTENYFSFIPEKDKKYFVILNSGNKKIKKQLPVPEKNIFTATYSGENNNNILFTILNNKNETKDTLARTLLYFIGNSQNIYFYGEKISLSKKTEITVPKSKLPKGVNKFTLTDINGKIITQIYFYNSAVKKEDSNIKHSIKEDSIFVKVKTHPKEISNISISATCNNKIEQNDTFFNNISNYIENYDASSGININAININQNINIINIETKKTNTVSRYIFNNNPKFEFNNEKGINIKGSLTTPILSFPIKNHSVSLFVLNKFNDRFQTLTNEKGQFSFSNLFYEDTLKVTIEAYRDSGKKGYLITHKEPKKLVTTVYTINSLSDLKAGKKISYKNYTSTSKDSTKNSSSIHTSADYVLYFDKININAYSSALEVIAAHVPGISATSMSSMRGHSSLKQSSEPLYLIDNIPTDKETINQINPNDVERVEVLRSLGKSAIYGSRGANGVIAVYTKTGNNVTWGKLDLNLTGFQKALSMKNTYNEIDTEKQTTFYWNPNISTNENGTVNFSFKIPQNISSFKIIIQGISEKGNPIYIEKLIER